MRDSKARDQRGEPCLWVFGPAWVDEPPARWFKAALPGSADNVTDQGFHWAHTGQSEIGAPGEFVSLCRCFPVLIPHRPTKILVEPAVCKSLKILEVASRALASLLITEREICGNRAGNRTVAGATLAASLRFSQGEQAKKIPTDKSWDFE